MTRTRAAFGTLRFGRTLVFALGFALLFALSMISARAQSSGGGDLPPGVQPFKPDAQLKLPANYEATLFQIDWTHPLLQASWTVGIDPDDPGALPRRWQDAFSPQSPAALRFQLIEPLETSQQWTLPQAACVDLTQKPGNFALPPAYILSTPAAPWRLGGDAWANRAVPWTQPPAQAGALAGVRWAGQGDELDGLPLWPFHGQCIISWTDPARGRTLLGVVQQISHGNGSLEELADWIKAMASERQWVAIHGLGPGALAQQDQTWLPAAPDPRHAVRVGCVLSLARAQTGDIVDLVRTAKLTLKDSGSEKGFEVDNLRRGNLNSAALPPRLWISSTPCETSSPPWVELSFAVPQQIHRVELVWPSALGWSEHFNPAQAVLKVYDQSFSIPSQQVSLKDNGQQCTTWTPRKPLIVERLRLEFPQGASAQVQGPARLVRLRVWGEWDGKEPKSFDEPPED